MNKKIIPIVLATISIILSIIAIIVSTNSNYFTFKNDTNNQDNNQNGIKEDKVETNKDENNSSVDKPSSNDNSNKNNQNTTDNKKEETNNKVEEPITNKTTENDVISYFTSKEKSISKTGQEDKTLREKAKETFVTIVDFIFYDKEIKGYTFKELTTKAKLKVIEIALSIDNKIDEYFPDYKDVIKDKYNNIKGKLAVKYLEFTSTLCEKVGEDTCNKAKEDFNSMKESFGLTWELIKELAASGSDKVKKFYENWRDS